MEFGITLNVMGSHVSAFSRGMMRFISYFNKIILGTLAGSLNGLNDVQIRRGR